LNLKRVTAEVSSDRSVRKVALSRESGPQGLRRPRFSFFLFTCQTARGRSRPLPFEKPKSRRNSSLRSGPEAFSLISVRSFRGAPSRRGERRAVWAYIGPARFHCQHPAPKNVREYVTKARASRAAAAGREKLTLPSAAQQSAPGPTRYMGGSRRPRKPCSVLTPNAALRPHSSVVVSGSVRVRWGPSQASPHSSDRRLFAHQSAGEPVRRARSILAAKPAMQCHQDDPLSG
jgi:hypothetical protein